MTKPRFRHLRLPALAVLAAAASPLPARAADAPAPAPGPAVTIGTEADYAPFESIGPNGDPVGFDIEIGDAVCAAAHLTCRWVNMEFDGLIPALDAHRIDAAMSEISVTPARREKVLFTNPVTRTAGALITAVAAGIDSAKLSTLDGKTVGVQSGTTYEVFAKQRLQASTVQVYETELEALQDLKAGRIDATLCDQGMGYNWLKQNAGKFVFAGPMISDPVVFGTGTAIAVRLGDTGLRDRLDRGLATIVSNGTYARIDKKYFPFSMLPGDS